MARFLISKSGKGLQIMKKFIPVRLCTPALPAFAERQNSYPFRKYLALKFGFLNSIRNFWDFRIAFLLKSREL
jgi:hypothetical protein